MNLKHLIVIIILIGLFGCNKRIVQQSKSSLDSSSINVIKSVHIDTTKSGYYTKLTTLVPLVSMKDFFDVRDPSSWSADVFVSYLKALPDSAELYPFIYETYNTTQKGISNTSTQRVKKDFSKQVQEKEIERKSSTPWVFGLVLTILGIFLVIWIVPRKK